MEKINIKNNLLFPKSINTFFSQSSIIGLLIKHPAIGKSLKAPIKTTYYWKYSVIPSAIEYWNNAQH